MKTNFLSVFVLFWAIIGSALWNLLYSDSFKGTLDSQHIFYFVFICLAVYSIGAIVYLTLKRKYKNVTIDISGGGERIYYESKLQYYIITFIAVITFSVITLLNIGGLSDVSVNFLGMSLFALVFVYFYRTSLFVLSKDKFVWKKGFSKIECLWADVIAIHHDIEPALTNVGRKFTSTSFFIETKSGFTKYADLTNIKVRGAYTPFSQGDKLVEEIKLKSNAPEKAGDVSMFKQTQKLKDIVFLLLAAFAVPALIIFLYCIFTGYKL